MLLLTAWVNGSSDSKSRICHPFKRRIGPGSVLEQIPESLILQPMLQV